MTTSIFSTSWIDIVFDGRNQQYGAYELRRITERNMLFAVLLCISFISVALNVVLLDNDPNGKSNFLPLVELEKDDGERVIANIPLKPLPPDKPEVIPPTPPRNPTEKLTTPVIVADNTDIIDTVLAQSEFENKETGAAKQKGDTGSFKIVAPPERREVLNPDPVPIAEIMPEFPGGEQALLKFIRDNTDYPDNAKDVGIEGTVYIEFVVDIDGRLTNIRVAKGPHKWLNDEGVRVVKSMPIWKPGMQNGQKVRVKYVVPIRFELS